MNTRQFRQTLARAVFFAVCAMLRHRHSLPQTRVTSHIVPPAPWPFPWTGLELVYHRGFFRSLFETPGQPEPVLLDFEEGPRGMNRYEDLRGPVLARLGSDGGKSVSRFLGRLPVEQIRPEITRLDSNLTLHHSAPRIFTAAPGLPHPSDTFAGGKKFHRQQRPQASRPSGLEATE